MWRGIVVGLGGRARSWIEVVRAHPEVELVGFVEPAEATRHAVREQYGLAEASCFPALEDALSAVEAEFVLDITPPAAHERVATTAFAAGLHVLQEKPLSDDWEAAKRTVAAGEAHGRVYMITQNYRFGAVPRTTRPLVAEGRLGRLEQGVMLFYRTWARLPGTHYVTMPFPLIKDMGIHHFDLLRYVLGQEPVEVRATTWNPSWGWHAGDASHTIEIRFDGGCHLTHHACGCSVGRQSPWNGDLRLEGELGSLTWEEDRIFLTCWGPEGAQSWEEIPHAAVPPGQEACLREFLDAIREGREPECSGRDNLRSLAVVFAAVESARTAQPVRIADLF